MLKVIVWCCSTALVVHAAVTAHTSVTTRTKIHCELSGNSEALDEAQSICAQDGRSIAGKE